MLDKYEFSNICYINRKIKNYNIGIVFFLIILLFLILSFFTKYEILYDTSGYIVIEDGKHYLKLNVYEEDIIKITDSNKLIFNDNTYYYTIDRISYELFIDAALFKNYKEIYIDSKFEGEENKLVKIKIFVRKEKLLKYIINYIFGED